MSSYPRRPFSSRSLAVFSVAGAVALAVALASCGKSSSNTAAGGSGATTTNAPAPTVTISSANVPGVGTVLVNDQGLTMYILTSEAGGKITCTDASGCTKVWPDTELPPGVTSAKAGTGVDASKLGTVSDATGSLYVTYAGYPLYTFSHDTGPGMANGEGITSFGGTWETMMTTGTPVVKTATSGATPTTAASATTTTYNPYGS